MTRTDPPNPTPDARPPLTTAERDQLDSHLREANKGTALAREADPNSPAFPDLLDQAASELAAARRIVHGHDDTAALATAGVLAPIGDDVEACGEAYALSGPGDEYDGEGMQAALDLFVARLAERLPAPATNPLATEAGQPARLVITDDDVEVAFIAYTRALPHGHGLVVPVSIRAALESYARRIELGLATGTAVTPAEPEDPWEGHPLTEMYGGKDAPRCATCNRPYSRQEAAAGMITCEHCPPPGAADDETAGPDGDECSQDCTCRAGWTEPGQ